MRHIVAIELLAAAQGIDFHRPLQTFGGARARAHRLVRQRVPYLDQVDRIFAPDIAADRAELVDGDRAR